MAGDRRTEIEQLFLQHGKGVGSYILARIGDPELAEELTSRVFLTIVRQFHQVRGTGVSWLWAIARNELARHFRDRRLHQSLDEAIADAGDTPVEHLVRSDRHVRLQAALDRLPADLREIVSMKFFLGMPNLEIAQATGLSPSHVGVKIHRTLKELRGLMEGPAGTPAERVEEHNP